MCVSIDTIEDTCEALLNFEAEGIGDSNGEKYLRLYGVFQAVFIQQSAIEHLCKSLVKPFPKIKDISDRIDVVEANFPNWHFLRELRNMAVGHPIEYKRKRKGIIRRCVITRVSISTQGFWLVLCNEIENKIEHREIDLQKSYLEYKKEASTILDGVLRNLEG